MFGSSSVPITDESKIAAASIFLLFSIEGFLYDNIPRIISLELNPDLKPEGASILSVLNHHDYFISEGKRGARFIFYPQSCS